MPFKSVRNKRPSVPLFRSSLTQSAVSVGPTMQAQMKVTQLKVKNNCSPEMGLDPKSVTNQSEKPAMKSPSKDVTTRTLKLLRFLEAIRSSRSATDRNCSTAGYYPNSYPSAMGLEVALPHIEV